MTIRDNDELLVVNGLLPNRVKRIHLGLRKFRTGDRDTWYWIDGVDPYTSGKAT